MQVGNTWCLLVQPGFVTVVDSFASLKSDPPEALCAQTKSWHSGVAVMKIKKLVMLLLILLLMSAKRKGLICWAFLNILVQNHKSNINTAYAGFCFLWVLVWGFGGVFFFFFPSVVRVGLLICSGLFLRVNILQQSHWALPKHITSCG